MKKLACFVMSFVMFLSAMPANVAWAEELDNGESAVCEHQLEFTSILRAATCTATGIGKAVCTICGESLGYQSIPMLEHTFGEYEVIVEATCDGNAVERAECVYGCGATDEREVAESALGHLWDDGTITVEKTCTEDQVKVYTCTRCEASYTETEESTGHQYSVAQHKDATCAEDGKDVYVCSECGDTYEEVIPGVGVVDHIPGNDEYVPATCEECGKAVTYCTVCHELLNEELLGELDPALGHNYVNNVCTRCGEEDYIAAELGENTVAVAAGETVLLKFVAPADGKYEFFTEGNEDTYGYLYDSTKQQIASDDDGGNGSNFYLSYEMQHGEVYYIGVSYLSSSKTGEIKLVVEENMIASIEVAPVEILQETGGERHGVVYNDTTYYYWHYVPDYWDLAITINYKDGHSVSGSPNEIYEQTGYTVSFSFEEAQDYDNPIGVGMHCVNAFFMGSTTTFEVNIVDTYIESISIDVPEIVEYTEGSWDNKGTPDQYWRYHTDISDLDFTMQVVYKNGDSFEGSWNEIRNQIYKVKGEYPEWKFDAVEQSASTQLDVGENRVGTLVFGRYIVDLYINIVETPVERIDVKPVTVIEGNSGAIRPVSVDIYFKDGSELLNKTPEEIKHITGYSISVDYVDPMNMEYGENIVSFLYYGKRGEFIVQYVECPILRFEVDPWVVTGLEHPILEAEVANLTGTIYLKDGSVFNGRFSDFCAQYGIIRFYEPQFGFINYSEGELTAEINILGCKETVQLVINKIDRFEVEDVTLVKGQYGNPQYKGSIYYQNGDIYKGYFTDILIFSDDLFRDSFRELISNVGSYEMSVSIRYSNVKSICKLHVIEDPVDTVVFDENTDGRWGTIYFKDGTSQYLQFGVDDFYYNEVEYLIEVRNFAYGDDPYVAVSIFGKEYKCPVSGKRTQDAERIYKSVTAYVDDDLYLVFEKMDGSFETVKVLQFEKSGLWTDHGYFDNVGVIDEGNYYADGPKKDPYSLIFYSLGVGCSVPDNEVFEKMMLPNIYRKTAERLLGDVFLEYTGEVNSENIDGVVAFAVAAKYFRYFRENAGPADIIQCPVEKAIRAVYDVFGIELTDISECSLINPITGMVNCAFYPGISELGMFYSNDKEVQEDNGKMIHLNRETDFINMFLSSDYRVLGFIKGSCVDKQIVTLSDGQQWFLFNGMLQLHYSGAVTIDGIDYDVVDGVVQNNNPNKPSIQGSSLTLNGDIGLNFYLNLDAKLVEEGAYAVFEQNGTLTAPMLLSEAVHQGKQYKLIYHVAAKEMDDTIILKLYDGEGNLLTLYKGEDFYENGYPYSVNTYVELALESETVSDELKELMRNMRQYGSCAQSYFGYGSGSVESLTVDSGVFEPYGMTYRVSGYDVFYYGSSLLLKDMTILRHYFTITGSPEDYVVTINGRIVPMIRKNGLYYVEIADIAAQDLDEMSMIKICTAEGEEEYRMVYGAFSYANLAMDEGSDELKNLMAAMYQYYNSAETYFAAR